jgi:hypothetical protein
MYGTSFSQIKVKKKSQSSRNQGFSYFFCLVIEVSIPLTDDPEPDPGGPKTCGSGSAILLAFLHNNALASSSRGVAVLGLVQDSHLRMDPYRQMG